jgi:hypothetical protein
MPTYSAHLIVHLEADGVEDADAALRAGDWDGWEVVAVIDPV